jgi:uncharacterized protein GlcG (DUF336 family)
MKKLAISMLVAFGLSIGPVASQAQDAMFTSKSLTPEIALKAVTAALHKCRADGYQVAVVVSDRAGLVQAAMRDRFAGAHTFDTARRKAWTAASFRSDTSGIAEFLAENPQQAGIYQITDVMAVGGGKMIDAAGTLVGAIGVSGAPNGDIDEVCAAAGLEAIEEDILF